MTSAVVPMFRSEPSRPGRGSFSSVGWSGVCPATVSSGSKLLATVAAVDVGGYESWINLFNATQQSRGEFTRFMGSDAHLELGPVNANPGDVIRIESSERCRIERCAITATTADVVVVGFPETGEVPSITLDPADSVSDFGSAPPLRVEFTGERPLSGFVVAWEHYEAPNWVPVVTTSVLVGWSNEYQPEPTKPGWDRYRALVGNAHAVTVSAEAEVQTVGVAPQLVAPFLVPYASYSPGEDYVARATVSDDVTHLANNGQVGVVWWLEVSRAGGPFSYATSGMLGQGEVSIEASLLAHDLSSGDRARFWVSNDYGSVYASSLAVTVADAPARVVSLIGPEPSLVGQPDPVGVVSAVVAGTAPVASVWAWKQPDGAWVDQVWSGLSVDLDELDLVDGSHEFRLTVSNSTGSGSAFVSVEVAEPTVSQILGWAGGVFDAGLVPVVPTVFFLFGPTSATLTDDRHDFGCTVSAPVGTEVRLQVTEVEGVWADPTSAVNYPTEVLKTTTTTPETFTWTTSAVINSPAGEMWARWVADPDGEAVISQVAHMVYVAGDTTPPVATIDPIADGVGPFTISGTAADPSGLQQVKVEIWEDGAINNIASLFAFADGNGDWSVSWDPAGNTGADWEARATFDDLTPNLNAVTLVESFDITSSADTTDPVVTVNAVADGSGPFALSGSVSDDVAVASVAVSMYQGATFLESVPAVVSGGSWSVSWDPGVNVGTGFTAWPVATDTSGNSASVGTAQFEVTSGVAYAAGNLTNGDAAALALVPTGTFGTISQADIALGLGPINWSNGLDNLEKVGGAEPYIRTRYPWVSAGVASMQFGVDVPDQTTCWMAYDWMFDEESPGVPFKFNGTSGTQWDHGGKMPGLAGGSIASGSGGEDASSGFSTRLMWQQDGRLILYAYHAGKIVQYGEAWQPVNKWGVDGTSYVAPTGQWIRIIQKVVLNSAGSVADGAIDLWIDHLDGLGPVHRYQRSSIEWRSGTGYAVDLGLYSTFFGGGNDVWHPGSSSGDHTQNSRFRNLQIGTNPLFTVS